MHVNAARTPGPKGGNAGSGSPAHASHAAARSSGNPGPASGHRQAGGQAGSHAQNAHVPEPPRTSAPRCYQVLRLPENCTREQAHARLRELAHAYHPDRVSGMATEFQAVARQRMTEINSAYLEMKRLRGW